MRSSPAVNSERINVLVADSNLMACRFLAGLLGRQRDFDVVACSLDEKSLLRSVQQIRIDVALVAAGWAIVVCAAWPWCKGCTRPILPVL